MNSRKAIFDEGIDVSVGHRVNAATAPAVSAVRPASRNVLFAPETDDAVPTLSCVDFDERFVYELHGRCGYRNKKALPRG